MGTSILIMVGFYLIYWFILPTIYAHLCDIYLEKAKYRIDNHFAFVGLVEAWNASVCLFHRMFGSRMHDNEVMNLRPADTARYSGRFRIATHLDLLNLTELDDPIDFQLYKYVRAKFIALLEEYGLNVPDTLQNSLTEYN